MTVAEKPRIRPLETGDFEQVIACQPDLYAVNFPHGRVGPPFVESQRQWINDHLRSEEPNGFFVAEAGGRVVGFVWGRVLENPLEGREGFVMQNYVLPDWRGQGLGRRLVERLEAFFGEHRVVKMVLNASLFNDPALKLYRSVGFEAVRYEMEKRMDGKPVRPAAQGND